MTGTIHIKNLRNIRDLRFEIPDRGVWLLTAGNGAGKTSLLACLRRIGHANAFPVHFPTSLRSDRLDNHVKCSVVYEINGQEVEYAYRGERWTPRPRSNSHLFKRFGYSSVTYIGATAERITPRPEDFDTRLVRPANKKIIEAANQIFETSKFNALRTINLSRGVGNDAFVLALATSPITYHSEKHFSLGELCVLKLLRLLIQVDNNSMIIVDELEMALHPRAQVKLFKFLEKQANDKSLTVIFSTHSVTLLKTAPRRNLIYLERLDNGEIRTIRGCYPTYAIGNIASDEETLPDIVIYVEDVFARDMIMSFFQMYTDEKFSDPTERPSAKVIPVGGFKEVVAFLERNQSVLPSIVCQKAFLDEDVRSETLVEWKRKELHGQLDKFSKLTQQISYLPFTPEVGLVRYIKDHLSEIENKVRLKCSDNQIRIHDIISSADLTMQGSKLRRHCKDIVEELISYLSSRTQKGEDGVREMLCDVFANQSWSMYKADFMRKFGSMI